MFAGPLTPGDPMPHQFCTVERRGRLLLVTINRPQRRNALHPPASYELQQVWDEYQRDDDLWVAVVTGAGDKAFCAGADLKEAALGEELHAELRARQHTGFGGLPEREGLLKPVIAAVNGVALGGGFELALACDIIVAAEHAQMGLPEPLVGRFAGSGGIHRLPRMIPSKVAWHMMLTGQPVSARRAFELGLVSEVVPADQVLPRALAIAEQILACAPLAIRATMQAKDLLHLPVVQAMRLGRELPATRAALNADDRLEGARAFAQKRKPSWQGR
jgi:enoyl-CoA hydratase/carnithine racemase